MLVSGGVSGGHLNPAVSVAVASIGKFPWWKVGDMSAHFSNSHILNIMFLATDFSNSPTHNEDNDPEQCKLMQPNKLERKLVCGAHSRIR